MQGALLDHLAFGVPALEPVAELLVAELGGRAHDAGPGRGFRFWQWEFAGGARIEILTPEGPPGGFLHRFLAARGPGPHHLTFKVPELSNVLAQVREAGIEPVGIDTSDPSWLEAFLHPKQAQGIVVQLAESHPERSPDTSVATPFPETSPAGDAVQVVGVRLSCRSEARARSQWESLLGGRERASADGLRFVWPDSPLGVSVQIDAGAPEGPLALELAADKRLALPDGPHPLLGLPLVQIDASD